MSIAAGDFHTAVIDEDGYVLVCGSNTGGALGTGDFDAAHAFVRLTSVFHQYGAARQVAAAGSRMAIVTDAGDLLMCGSNVNGELGLGDTEDRRVPTRVGLDHVIMVACADNDTAALTADGGVYTFGDGSFGKLGHGNEQDHHVPMRVPASSFNHEAIVMLAVGLRQSVALSENGHVYTWGACLSGALGLGEHWDDCSEPQQIDPAHFPSAAADRVVFVAAGKDHTAAVTLSGQLYTWGDGRFGKTGHGDDRRRLVPTRVNLPHVVTVSCAEEHAVAVTQDGRLWVTGLWNEIQLGQFFLQALHTFAPVHGNHIDGARVVMADSRHRHSVAVTDEGVLLTFGENRSGELGHNDNRPRDVPTRVALQGVGSPHIGRCRYLPEEHALAFALSVQARLGAGSPARVLAGESGLFVMIANFGRAWVAGVEGPQCEGLVRLLGGVTAEERPRYRQALGLGRVRAACL